MSDLISRKALKQTFFKDNRNTYGLEEIAEIIDNQIAAYDVDKVVERLEEKIKALGGPSSTDEAQDVAVKEIMWCTDVVKGGGVDE